MQISQFDNIRVVLAESNTDLRKKLKSCLQEHGFRSVLDTGSLAQVAKAVNEGNVDLLIADTALSEGDFNDYISELRHGRHGENPFLVVITLVDAPSRAEVQHAIDSGTDHVLAKPFKPGALIAQVLELTHQRKRFVVTTDYIGPDRRSGPRAGGVEIPQIDVPNALRQRMTGQMSDGILRRAIDASKATINEQKVVRHAYQIGWLLDRVLPDLREPGGEKSETYQENMDRLLFVSRDISKRIASTRYAHVAELCMTLGNMVEQGLARGFDKQDINLIGKMADLIEGAFDPNRDDMVTAYRRNPGIVRSTTGDKSGDFPSATAAAC